MLNVMVLFGGKSTEHSVSLVSASYVMQNMNKDKYNIIPVGITKEGEWFLYHGQTGNPIEEDKWFKNASHAVLSPDAKEKCLIKFSGDGVQKIDIDVVFPVLHGMYGEDGTIQGLLEVAGIPYVGCGVLASSVGMDKIYTKLVFDKAGIPQARYCVVYRYDLEKNMNKYVEEIENKLGYPCFIKPSNSGSSVGISKAHDKKELEEGLRYASKYDRKILVEEFINCREVECAVLGNEEPEVAGPGEILPANEFYDFEAKYKNAESRIEISANLPQDTADKIREYAINAYKSLDCSGLSRIDFFVDKDNGKIFLNEINTLPGFTSISMYPQLWANKGLAYSELIDKLINYAMKRDKAY